MGEKTVKGYVKEKMAKANTTLPHRQTESTLLTKDDEAFLQKGGFK
jgi:hypothetical protein